MPAEWYYYYYYYYLYCLGLYMETVVVSAVRVSEYHSSLAH